MKYTFEILGVSPVLDFFNHQQKLIQRKVPPGLKYLGTYQCTLDALIESAETIPSQADWSLDQAVDSVIQFWMNHPEIISYWKQRLNDAGKDNLLVSRVSDFESLKAELESLLGS
ncbi:MAG: hypothetical protein F6J90_33555 [Moorea sp. SIOASIH]|uniref:hypothetical protein n=1 Tax=Moorena sp. SIOASIH TaxID=2607817 RepID=UPI0013B7FF75|nr:hypothetical protein [Moorena sp. SIOASIH]NEO40996.1 hypothetical protein [Moorena sp. SIOASIH]